MSYIIPQKMPLRCFECGHISSSTMDGYSCKIVHKSLASEHGINLRRPDWCPLIEIPTPHGRLIDADEFKNYIRSGYEEMKHLFNENLKAATLVTEGFCKDIDEAPTVIEAED